MNSIEVQQNQKYIKAPGVGSIRFLLIIPEAEKRLTVKTALQSDTRFEITEVVHARNFLDDSSTKKKFDIIFLDWQNLDTSPSIFLQSLIQKNCNTASSDFIFLAHGMQKFDTLLIDEMGIEYSILMNLPAGVYAHVDAILKSRTQRSPTRKLISELQEALRREDIKEIVQLLQNRELEIEVSSNIRFVPLKAHAMLLCGDAVGASQFLHNIIENENPSVCETLPILSLLGRCLCHMERYDEALIIFERLASKSPENFSHKVSLGDTLLGLNRVEDAKKQFDDILRIDPTNTDANAGRAKTAIVEGASVEALPFIKNFNYAIESYSLASFFNNRAVAFARSGNLNEAIAIYKSAIPLMSRFKGRFLFNLGMAYMRLGEKQKAQEYFAQAEKEPDSTFLKDKKIFSLLSAQSGPQRAKEQSN
jgi:tetratricopeptide (TPR) repeat protein